jgi:lipopolysaccharide biosynthesis glycosyltransferase
MEARNEMKDADYLHIAFALDSRFEIPMRVTMHSILKRSSRPMHFYTLTDDPSSSGFSPTNYPAETRFTNFLLPSKAQEVLNNLPALRSSKATFYRLFFPELMQGRCDKFLCLDSDLLVLCDLGPLFDIPMNNAKLGAVCNGSIKTTGDRVYFDLVGVPEHAKLFNGGVVMYNTREWRDVDMATLLRTWTRKMMFGFDQSVLNAAFWDSTVGYPEMYNRLVCYEKQRPLTGPGIYHFVGGLKPWDIGGCLFDSTGKLWWQEWADARLEKMPRKFGRGGQYWREFKRLMARR